MFNKTKTLAVALSLFALPATAFAQTTIGTVQVSDQGALATWVDEVLATSPAEVARYRAGETKLMAFFVGQVMKRSKGKADPKAVQPVLQEKLE